MESTSAPERLRIGQLLGSLLRIFRADLAARGDAAHGVDGIRPAHLQVFGTITADGSRLTDLAGSAGMSLSAMAELVDDLESLGYVERLPDPADGRAKLVCLTGSGWRAIRTGRAIIEQIELDWGARLGPEQFESLCRTMQDLLDELDPRVRQQYKPPPNEREQDSASSLMPRSLCRRRQCGAARHARQLSAGVSAARSGAAVAAERRAAGGADLRVHRGAVAARRRADLRCDPRAPARRGRQTVLPGSAVGGRADQLCGRGRARTRAADPSVGRRQQQLGGERRALGVGGADRRQRSARAVPAAADVLVSRPSRVPALPRARRLDARLSDLRLRAQRRPRLGRDHRLPRRLGPVSRASAAGRSVALPHRRRQRGDHPASRDAIACASGASVRWSGSAASTASSTRAGSTTTASTWRCATSARIWRATSKATWRWRSRRRSTSTSAPWR